MKNPTILSTLVLLLAVTFATHQAFAGATAQQVTGMVEIGTGEPPHWSILAAGDEIAPDDRIRTGSDGRVEISMDAGTVRVHENSMLRLPPPAGDADQVSLEKGHSLFDVLRRAGRRFEVHTPTVVVSVKGTRFGVDARGSVGEVVVYRGMVGVRRADTREAIETLVREGFLAASLPGAPIELNVAPAGDPWSSWQDFGAGMEERIEVPAQRNDVGRAKDSMLRRSDPAVLDRAAKRRPEIAKQIEALKKQQASEGVGPAAPLAVEAVDEKSKGQKGEDDGKSSSDQLRDATLGRTAATRDQLSDLTNSEGNLIPRSLGLEGGGGGGLIGGAGEIIESLSSLNQELGVGIVPAVSQALEEAGQTLGAGGGSFTETELLQQLETVLLNQGMDPTLAGQVVQSLMGN